MRFAPLRILLADDSTDEHFLFRHVLRHFGNQISIQTVENGADLTDLLSQPDAELPHLLFLDLNMPLKNGKESLAEIRSNTKFDAISVLIYSTSDEEHDIDETFKLGANLYVAKPQEYSVLQETLTELVDLFNKTGFPKPSRKDFVFTLPLK